MTDLSAYVERVAEAIWRADRPLEAPYGWDQCLYPKMYRRMAQAAIDGMQLTEETKYLADGMGGITYHQDGTTTHHSRPCTKMGRLVSPWVVMGE